MSYYYEYNFISPEPIYSTVKEELKSYFDTGAVDDLLFPTWLNKCLDKIGKASYIIVPEIIEVQNFTSRLPDNFYAVREAWLCAELPLPSYQDPSSFYSQTSKATTIQVSPYTTNSSCPSENCPSGNCVDPCLPEMVQVVYKTTNEIARSFTINCLLKPGKISSKTSCNVNYSKLFNSGNPYASTINSFDIVGNKFVTNFRNGYVYLIYYATDYDEDGNQLIPDNYEVKEYIESFLKFKVIETLVNQTHDETFNQLMQKLNYYKSQSDESFILALSELRRETVYDKQRNIRNLRKRNQKYEISNKSVSSIWRRNGG